MSYKSIATESFRVVDRNTATRIINAIIMKFFVLHGGQKSWVYDAEDELRDTFDLHFSAPRLRQFLSALRRGTRDARVASFFNGKVFARAEKDGMYREMDALIEYILEDEKRYVGLPANQLVHVVRKYDHVTACERTTDTYNFMMGLKSGFLPREDVSIVKDDICEYLLNTNEKFSVYDIDLMTYANKPGLIDKLAAGICRTTMPKSVICIVTCCGRKITQEHYKEIMPQSLIEKIERGGKNVTYHKSGQYTDQITPMRYEFLVVEE